MPTLAEIGSGVIGQFAIGDYQLLRAADTGGTTTVSGVGTVTTVATGDITVASPTTAVGIQRINVIATARGTTTVDATVTLRKQPRPSERIERGDQTGVPEDTAFPLGFDETGDVATVSGSDFYEQHALLLGASVIETQLGQPLTANDITEIESRVERVYSQSPYFNSLVQVSVTDIRDDAVDIRVRLRGETDVEIPITQRDVDTIEL